MERLQGGLVDNLVKYIANAIKEEGIQTAEANGFEVVKHIGIGSLGGYYADGRMYPGQCPKRREFEGISLSAEIEKELGDGWKASINNDGMVQALISAEMLLNPEKREALPQEAIDKGKIMVIVPGTSIGGGGVLIDEDGHNVSPMPGPHQIWDIVLRKLQKGEEFLKEMGEDDCPSFKKAREENSFISLDIGGAYLDVKAERLGFSNGKEMGRALLEDLEPAKRKAIEKVYIQSARDLSMVIRMMYLGKGEKAVVNGPREIKEFWDNTKNTEIFILGGWLVGNQVIKDIVFSEVKEGLKKIGFSNIIIVAQDEIPGLGDFVSKAGVLGAALLVPEGEL